MKVKAHILAWGFVLFISFPILNKFIPILPDAIGNENRRLSSFPKFQKDSLELFSKKLENYLSDHISIRNRFIELYNQLNIFIFHSSPTNIKAFAGKDGQYFLAGEELRAYNGNKSLSKEQLIQLKEKLLERKKMIEANGAKLFIAIVPVKASIYSDKMPEHIIRSESGSMGQQVLAFLKKEDIDVIDLYAPLIEARKKADTYFNTDNHWNDWGAAVAANQVLTEVKKYFKNVALLDLNRKINKELTPPGNIAKMLSIDKQVLEYNYLPALAFSLQSKQQTINKYKCPDDFAYCQEFQLMRKTKNDSLPTALIIRDSFGERFFPYFSEQCNTCIAIYDAWHYGANEKIIKAEKPDIVLYLILESNLENLLIYN
jgi:alginate O-acetyltransferase complex protein AlgJ